MSFLPHKGVLAIAIAIVIDIALNARGRLVTAKMLAARHRLSQRHLEPVLQALVRDDILKSLRGPRGGYELARDPRSVSADDILRAVGTVENINNSPLSESPLIDQVVMPALAQAEQAFSSALAGISVEDLTRMAETKFGSDERSTDTTDTAPPVNRDA
jgi:Rrf2 family protein